MAIYGRYVTAGDVDYGEISQNQQRTSVFNKTTENGWGYAIGFWGGRTSGMGIPTVKAAVWTTSSLTPATRMAYHNGVAVSTYQTHGGSGQAYVVPMQNVNSALSPGTNAIKMYANTNYAIGLLPTGTMMSHAMVQAAYISGDNEQFYHKDGITTPANPNGYTYSSNEGWISAWIEYQPNRTPTATTSSPSGLITTTSPTFTATFSDPDSTYGDRLTQFRIQVIRASDGALMWDTGNTAANATERSNSTISRGYGGTGLVAGVEYWWNVAVADDFGTWSAWSGWRSFTVNGGGAVSPSTPSTKQNTLQPSPFSATWFHASSLAMNATQVRILQGGSVIRTGAEVAKAATNGASFTTTWAEQFGSYALSWGVAYTWQIRGRDSGSLWSNWSTQQSFSTNNPPDIPYNLTPTNSTPSSSRPLLKATATDADGDSVTVKARIKNNAGTVLFTRTMTHIGSGNYTYQTTSTDLATTATYKWDAYSYDGYLYSGAVTSEGSATKSSEAAFIYGAGPVITLTGPSSTVTTSNPTITWTVTDQQKRRVIIYQNGVVVHDTGTVTTTVTNYMVPSGVIRNGLTYTYTVTVTNSAPLEGTSSTGTFTVAYPTPAAITGLFASPEYQRFDATPSSIRLTWNESTDPNFLEYLVIRSDGMEELILAHITSASQNVFIDYNPQSGVEYDYSVVQATLQGLDVTISTATSAHTSVNLEHVVINSVYDGSQLRVGLRLDSDRSFDHRDDLVLDQPWGNRAPVAAYGTSQYQTFSGTFTVANDEGITSARDHIDALRNVWKSRTTLCYRDERGRKFFCKISKFSEDDKRIQFYTVSLSLTEVAYKEGVN